MTGNTSMLGQLFTVQPALKLVRNCQRRARQKLTPDTQGLRPEVHLPTNAHELSPFLPEKARDPLIAEVET